MIDTMNLIKYVQQASVESLQDLTLEKIEELAAESVAESFAGVIIKEILESSIS